MDILSLIHADDILHTLSQELIVPTVVVLLLLSVYALYTLGAFVVEFVTERRRYAIRLVEVIERVEASDFTELDHVIGSAGLLDTQRDAALQVVHHACLPPDALEEVARKGLLDEENRYHKALSWTDAATKIAPMIGLMGTLIPLGPGLQGLSSGDLDTLSSALIVAFDTTVAGLVVAVVCYLVTRVRKRWYKEYLRNLEGLLNVLLEKIERMRDAGHGFAPSQVGAGRDAAADACERGGLKAVRHGEQ